MIAGLCITSRSDEERLAQSYVLFDQLQADSRRMRRSRNIEAQLCLDA